MSFGAGEAGANKQANYNEEAIQEMRRQHAVTQANYEPYMTAGKEAIPAVTSGAGFGGFSSNVDEILNSGLFENYYSDLYDEKREDVQGYLSKMGLGRSGTAVNEMAGLTSEEKMQQLMMAMGIEGDLYGRSSNLMASGQNAVAGLGGLGQSNSQGIASLLSNTGSAFASGLMADQSAVNDAIGDAIGVGGKAASMAYFYSDPKLKENVGTVGTVGPLQLVQWDWIDDVKDTFIGKLSTIGFLSTEVREHFPEFVTRRLGFDMVAYAPLLDHLEEEYA